MNVTDQMQQELQGLKECSNLRTLPTLIHEGHKADSLFLMVGNALTRIFNCLSSP